MTDYDDCDLTEEEIDKQLDRYRFKSTDKSDQDVKEYGRRYRLKKPLIEHAIVERIAGPGDEVRYLCRCVVLSYPERDWWFPPENRLQMSLDIDLERERLIFEGEPFDAANTREVYDFAARLVREDWEDVPATPRPKRRRLKPNKKKVHFKQTLREAHESQEAGEELETEQSRDD